MSGGRRVPDVSVYLVTDAGLCGARTVAEVAALAAAGGATLVQLRDKSLSPRAMTELARALIAALAPFGVPLIVNDCVEAALASGAAGAHLGQGDLSIPEARGLLGPRAFLGLSVESLEHIAAGEALDVDYYGVSPIFLTSTKAELVRAWGLEGLAQARRATRRPLVAIGGIGPGNAEAVVRAGADGVAVVSALCAAADPTAAARELAAAVRRGKGA